MAVDYGDPPVEEAVRAVDEYIALQIRRVLVSLVADERRADYAHLPG